MTNDEKIIKEEELKKYVNSIIKNNIFEQKSNSDTVKNKNSESDPSDPNSPKESTTSIKPNRERPNRALLPNVKKNR